MKARSTSATAGPRVLATLFATAAVLATVVDLSSDATSSTASNGTITIGTHPPNALLAGPVHGHWTVVTDAPHTPIIKG